MNESDVTATHENSVSLRTIARNILLSKRAFAEAVGGEIFIAAVVSFGIVVLILIGRLAHAIVGDDVDILRTVERIEIWALCAVQLNYILRFVVDAVLATWRRD